MKPFIEQRADPYIIRKDGWYYFTASAPEFDRIILRKARTLAGLPDAVEKIVWTRHAEGPLSCNIWAPELHSVDGKWYIYFAAARGGADVQLQWAGDSRVYLLDGAGLAQLTEDDTGGLDAMQRQSQDKAPTNVIRLNGDFSIHTARLTVNRPCLLFAATGGCFGQLSTPMEFEYLLLSTLQNAPNAESWEKNLAESIGKGAEDDYSLCGIALNAGNFDELKRQLAGRTSQLYRTYIRGLDACTAEEKLQLWEHYKAHYHRLLCRV